MAEAFTNEPIDVAGLPRLEDQRFEPLHPAYLRVSLIGRAIFAVVVSVIGVIVATQVSPAWIPLAVAGGLLLLIALSTVLRVLEVNKMGYQIREHDISYRSGVILRNVETVPFVRVQHASLTQGPIERRFGLSTVHVNSAGSDLQLPGVPEDDANRITALVIERAGELVEES